MSYRVSLWLIACGLGFLESCASQQLIVKTVPSGADVYTNNGQKIGVTPLVVDPSKAFKGKLDSDFVHLQIKKLGFESQQIALEPGFYKDLSVTLKSQDQNHFQKVIVGLYNQNFNSLLVDFLKAQAMITFRQFDEASKAIAELKLNYPTLAPVYVLESDLYMAKGQNQNAVESLLTAYSLNPGDKEVARNLSELGVRDIPTNYKMIAGKKTQINKSMSRMPASVPAKRSQQKKAKP